VVSVPSETNHASHFSSFVVAPIISSPMEMIGMIGVVQFVTISNARRKYVSNFPTLERLVEHVADFGHFPQSSSVRVVLSV
jgi:hypothetical protein